jgi:hypothetical protein
MAAACALAVMILGGCGERGAEATSARRTVTLSDVPSNVLDAAKRELPGIDFRDAWKNVDRDGNPLSYEIRGQNKNGKIREVRVGLDGKILEKE